MRAAALDFEALETAVRRQVLEVAARTVEAHLNQDRSDTAPGLSCRCGGRARYAGRRPKQVRHRAGTDAIAARLLSLCGLR